jgi:hypothetical protein
MLACSPGEVQCHKVSKMPLYVDLRAFVISG